MPARCLYKSVLKQELSGIQVTTYTGVNNFQNISAMKLMFSSRMWKICCRLRKWNKKLKKCFPFLRQWPLNTSRKFLLLHNANTWDRQSNCYQTVLTLQTWLTEMFSNSTCLRLMEIYDKSASIVTSLVFNIRQQFDSTRVF